MTWPPTTEEDLRVALDGGLLEESHSLGVNRQLDKNKNLAVRKLTSHLMRALNDGHYVHPPHPKGGWL